LSAGRAPGERLRKEMQKAAEGRRQLLHASKERPQGKERLALREEDERATSIGPPGRREAAIWEIQIRLQAGLVGK